jgi:peptidyl-prolyl cis-trans isomerase B (cyclophilin B)
VPTNKQRREAARRKLERQLEARDERSRRRRQGNLIASVIGGIVVVAVVIGIVVLTNGHKSKQTAASTPAATSVAATSAASSAAATSAAPTAAAHPYPCTFTTSGTSAVAGIKKPTSTSPAKTGSVTIAVKSNLGNLTFTLNRAGAPCAVESFVSLVQQKYFNNSPCHRLVTNTPARRLTRSARSRWPIPAPQTAPEASSSS